ncbi:MAG TPA: 4Fe-4S binding protein [Dissulfurispiraceae bacterium]|nr:4Fe-4S binding protein [Dissulfurispiraceae bacterium]
MAYLKKLKAALSVLFNYKELERMDLFTAFPAVRKFFLDRRNLLRVRSAGDIAFTIIIIMGLFGPQEANRNISLFLAWGIWWTSVVLSWFIVGKFWCGLCPFPGIGRLLQKIGLSLNLEPSPLVRKYGIHVSVFLFAAIIWSESVTEMKSWPMGTALLLLSILAGATILGAIYKGQAWCRHLCPLGKIIGTAATISMLELRPDHNKCRSCKTFTCKKGVDNAPGCPVYLGAFNIRNNIECLMCGRCVYLCDKDSPRLRLRNPFVELILNKGRYITCSYIIPFLMGSQLARFAQHTSWYERLEAALFASNAAAFSLLLVLGFALFVVIQKSGARIFGITEDPSFGKFSPLVPVLVPFAFTGELVYRMDYFLSNIGDMIPTFGRQFGLDLDSLYFAVPKPVLYWTGMVTLALGAVSAAYVLYIFNSRDFEGAIEKKRYYMLNALVLMIFAIYIVLFSGYTAR